MTVRYYLLSTDAANERWAGREQLRDSLLDESGEDVRQSIAYSDQVWAGRLTCELLRSGELAPAQFLYTLRILAVPAELPSPGSLADVQLIEASTRSGDRSFLIFRPNMALEATDFARSSVDPWPEGTTLRSWDNPRGRMFLEPAIDVGKVPAGLEAFRLKDWPGVSNTVVSGRLKSKLEEWIGSDFVVFKELSC